MARPASLPGRLLELIGDGYIVAVDSSQSDPSELNDKVVIAWHKDNGLMVSRLRHYDHTEVLQPENKDRGGRRKTSVEESPGSAGQGAG